MALIKLGTHGLLFQATKVHVAVCPFLGQHFLWKCFGLCLLYGILFERGIQDMKFSSSCAWQEGQRCLLPCFHFLFGVLEGSACSSLLWHALPFGTCLIHPPSFCRSHTVYVKEDRTGQKREKQEALETDEGQLHLGSGSWKRM